MSEFKLTFSHFFTHMYFKKLQTTILKLLYQTSPKSLICQIAIQNPKHTKTLFMELFSALEQCPNLQAIPLCLFSKSYPFLTLLKPIHSIIFSNLFPPNPDPSASTISVKSYSPKLLYQIWFCFPLLYDNWY